MRSHILMSKGHPTELEAYFGLFPRTVKRQEVGFSSMEEGTLYQLTSHLVGALRKQRGRVENRGGPQLLEVSGETSVVPEPPPMTVTWGAVGGARPRPTTTESQRPDQQSSPPLELLGLQTVVVFPAHRKSAIETVSQARDKMAVNLHPSPWSPPTPPGKSSLGKTPLSTDVYSSFIRNHRNLEATKMPSTDEWVRTLWSVHRAQ